MPRYEILDTQDNVTNTILADAATIGALGYANFREVPEDAQPTVKPPLTKLEYMNRFTDAELAGIYTAAKLSVAVEVWLEKFKLASEINLDDPRTATGVQALEANGLIATGRAAEILA